MTSFHRNLCVRLALLNLSVMAAAAGYAREHVSRVNVIHVPGGFKAVKAQLGADGTIHPLLDAEDGPRYVKSTDAGVTFSAPIKIVDAASQKPGLKFQGEDLAVGKDGRVPRRDVEQCLEAEAPRGRMGFLFRQPFAGRESILAGAECESEAERRLLDRKSTRLNSSHQIISYAVFCLKKKKKKNTAPALTL